MLEVTSRHGLIWPSHKGAGSRGVGFVWFQFKYFHYVHPYSSLCPNYLKFPRRVDGIVNCWQLLTVIAQQRPSRFPWKTAALPGSVGSSFNRQQPWLACGWTGTDHACQIVSICLGSGPPCLPQHLCRRSDPVLLAAVKCLLRTVPNLDACADLCFTIGHHQSFNHFLYPHSVHQTRIHSEFTLSPTTLRTGRRCPGKLWKLGWMEQVCWDNGNTCELGEFLWDISFPSKCWFHRPFSLDLDLPSDTWTFRVIFRICRSSRTQILFLAT